MEILRKPAFSIIRTPNVGPIALRSICYMDHTSIHMRVEIFEIGKVHETFRLPKPLRREGLLPHYRTLESMILAHTILGP